MIQTQWTRVSRHSGFAAYPTSRHRKRTVLIYLLSGALFVSGCASQRARQRSADAHFTTEVIAQRLSDESTKVAGATESVRELNQPAFVQLPKDEPAQVRLVVNEAELGHGLTSLQMPEDESLPSPQAAEPVKLTLDEAINACLVSDPKLRAGFEAIDQANAGALTASLKPNPELSVSQTLIPLTRPFTVDEQGGPPQLDVGIAYPIDWFLFGKRAAEMVSAARGVRVSQFEYEDLVRRRVTEVSLAFYDVLEAKSLLEVAQQNVENLARVEALTQKAVDAGGRPQVELNRIRLDLLQSRQALRESELALVTTKARLSALLGRRPADFVFDVEGTLDGPFIAEPLSPDQAYAEALQNRPDIRALRSKLVQANTNVEMERRKAYPSVTTQIGYTRQFQEKAIGFPDANSWGVGVDMSLPISDRNQGNRAHAASVASQSRYELQSGEIELEAEIKSVIEEFRTAQANAEAVARDQLRLAAEVRDSINSAYEIGGRPLIDVLDAQRNYGETYRIFTTTRANYWRARARYQAAIGQQDVQ